MTLRWPDKGGGGQRALYTAFAQDQAGYGLAQWTYHTRKAALLAFVQAEGKSAGDLEGSSTSCSGS